MLISALLWQQSDAILTPMRRITVRVDDSTHARLIQELPAWRQIRGPKFSLNDLCTEKLLQSVEPTHWIQTGTTGSSNNVIITDVSFSQPQEGRGNSRKRKVG